MHLHVSTGTIIHVQIQNMSKATTHYEHVLQLCIEYKLNGYNKWSLATCTCTCTCIIGIILLIRHRKYVGGGPYKSFGPYTCKSVGPYNYIHHIYRYKYFSITIFIIYDETPICNTLLTFIV